MPVYFHAFSVGEVLSFTNKIRQHGGVSANSNIPLAVDLDGTLIRTDTLFEMLARLLRRNPLSLFLVLAWWIRGRAHLKARLVERILLDPADLPYHGEFIQWLQKEKQSGRKLVLATAADVRMGRLVASHVGLFDQVYGSDGLVNLRSQAKLALLEATFGVRGFDYAGNSTADIPVWRGSREAVLVNASKSLQRQAELCAVVQARFCQGYNPWTTPMAFCRELFLHSGYAQAILGALLLALAFPKTSFAGFAWVAPALLAWAAQNKKPMDSFRVGCLGGFAFWMISLSWLLSIPYPFFPILGWLALSAFLSLYFGAWTWLVSGYRRWSFTWVHRLLWSLGGAASWVGLEMIRARLLGGFPWSFLGVSQYQYTPLIQMACITGVYGVSFLVVWFSLAMGCAAARIRILPNHRHVWQQEIVLPLLVVVFCFTGGFFRMSHTSSSDRQLRVTSIQPDIPQTVIWNPDSDHAQFDSFLALNEAALTNATDVLLWPESAVPEMSPENCNRISLLARQHHVWLILNGEDVKETSSETNYFNAAFLVNPEGRLAGAYHKQKLVIFGEYVPLSKWLPFLKWLTPISGAWTPGKGPQRFEITGLEKPSNPSPDLAHAQPSDQPGVVYLGNPGGQTGMAPASCHTSVLICFEDTFPGVARSAARQDIDFFVNLTNDGWFGQGSEQWQHLANAVFRAVENGIPMFRCANNGVTCLINAQGGVERLFRTPGGSEYGRGFIHADVPLPSGGTDESATWYNRHGDVFGWACVGALALQAWRRSMVSWK